jgi:hypothetical protein
LEASDGPPASGKCTLVQRFIAVSTNSTELSDTYVKAKMTKFSALLRKKWKYQNFFKTAIAN